jgi:hypothetical protein
LAVAVILLFIGMGIQPAVADSSNNSELIEVTIKICKPLKIEEYTLMLPQEKIDDLNSEFDKFKVKLDNAISKRDTIEIYNDMIVSLDRLGMLPNHMTVNEAKQLITGKNYPFFDGRIASSLFENSNFLCLISGKVTSNSGFLLSYLAQIYFIPFRIGGMMFFGTFYKNPNGGTHGDADSKGWIKTVGMLGKKEWTNKFRGAIFNFPIGFWFPDYRIIGRVGIVGLIGITIETIWDEVSFIGFAPWVKIKNV